MEVLPRDTRRLLVELAFVAANHRLRGEIPAFIDAVRLLIDDEGDRALCLARLHMESGDVATARRLLAGRGDSHAALLATLLSSPYQAAPRLITTPSRALN